MPDSEVNIELYCVRCGDSLFAEIAPNSAYGAPSFLVDPCEKCLDNSEDEGYKRGVQETEEAQR